MTTATFLINRRASKRSSIGKSIAVLTLKPFSKIFSNGKAFFITSFILLTMLVALYIYQINILTKEYYLMNHYEQRISEMSQENRDLQVEFASAGVMKDIAQKIQNLEFNSQGQVKYLHIFEDTLAVAK